MLVALVPVVEPAPLQREYGHPSPYTAGLNRYAEVRGRPKTLSPSFVDDLLEVTGGGKARDFSAVSLADRGHPAGPPRRAQTICRSPVSTLSKDRDTVPGRTHPPRGEESMAR